MRIKKKIDYKKELEAASKSMIMIHDPKLLIKLIVRTIVSKVQVRHAAMLIYDSKTDSYVLNISRGETGIKIPAGYARFDRSSPIIKLFNEEEFRPLTINKNAIISEDLTRMIWQESILNGENGRKKLLHEFAEQLQMLNSVACVPAYYQDTLLAILLLGAKEDHHRFEQEELDFFAALASDAAMAIRNAQLFADLKRELSRNRELFIQTTMVLGSTIEAKDKYTHGHTERVTNYSLAIAKQMVTNGSSDFPQNFFENLYISATLHDIGKIGIPETILNKSGQLTPEEFAIMKRHTLKGEEMLRPLSAFKDCIDGVKYHHERYNGTGYPEGLKGEQIPMQAAIIAVADTFDAITTDRPYRKGKSKKEAMEEIKKQGGVQFHPLIVKAMVELWEERKI